MEKTHASVQTQISLHQIANAMEELAETFPLERLNPETVHRIQKAAVTMLSRIVSNAVKLDGKAVTDRRGPCKDRRTVNLISNMFRRRSAYGRRAKEFRYTDLPNKG